MNTPPSDGFRAGGTRASGGLFFHGPRRGVERSIERELPEGKEDGSPSESWRGASSIRRSPSAPPPPPPPQFGGFARFDSKGPLLSYSTSGRARRVQRRRGALAESTRSVAGEQHSSLARRLLGGGTATLCKTQRARRQGTPSVDWTSTREQDGAGGGRRGTGAVGPVAGAGARRFAPGPWPSSTNFSKFLSAKNSGKKLGGFSSGQFWGWSPGTVGSTPEPHGSEGEVESKRSFALGRGSGFGTGVHFSETMPATMIVLK